MPKSMKFHTIKYGDHHDQFARLYRPTDAIDIGEDILEHSHAPWPVVVIIHGGFFSQYYTVDNALVDTLPLYLVKRGYVAYMVEYRRVGIRSGGGWPETNDDILLSLRALSNQVGVDLTRVILLGHSAGGTLALWTCCKLAERNLGFTPKLCVAIAPVADLELGQKRGLSGTGHAIADYMKHYPCSYDHHQVSQASCSGSSTPSSVKVPAACKEVCQYKLASPSAIQPVEVPLLLCIGTDDHIIPKEYVDAFYDMVVHGVVTVELLAIEDADHFQVVNAKEEAWEKIFKRMSSLM